MFDLDKESPASLAGDLVRMVGRRGVDAIKGVGLFAIVAFWTAVVLWLVLAYFDE